MWNVKISPDVQEFLRKQDKHIEERLRKGLEKLKTDYPFHFLEHYESGNYYKYRWLQPFNSSRWLKNVLLQCIL